MASIRTIPFNLSLYTKVTSGPNSGKLLTQFRDGDDGFVQNVVWSATTDYDHDRVGVLRFVKPIYRVSSTGTFNVEVERTFGMQGSVTATVTAVSSTGHIAMTSGVDFDELSQVVWFDDQEVGVKSFPVTINSVGSVGLHAFTITLTDVTGGAELGSTECLVIYDDGLLNPSGTVVAEGGDIQAAADSASAGDIIYVTGTNSSNIRTTGVPHGGFLVDNSGTQASKIFIASNPTDAGIIDQSYALISDESGNGTCVGIYHNGSDIVYHDLEIRNCLYCGIYGFPTLGQTLYERVYVSDCHIHDIGNPPNGIIDYQLSTDTRVNITNITQSNPAVVTSVGHGYTTNVGVSIEGVVGMTEINGVVVADIVVLDDDTFELTGVDSTAFTAYSSGGVAINCAQADIRTENLGAIRIDHSDEVKISGSGSAEINDVYNSKTSFISNDVNATPLGMHSGVHGFQCQRIDIHNVKFHDVRKAVYCKQPSDYFNIGHRVHHSFFYNIEEACLVNNVAGTGNHGSRDVSFHDNAMEIDTFGAEYAAAVTTQMTGTIEQSERLWLYNNTMIGGTRFAEIWGFKDVVAFNNNIDGSDYVLRLNTTTGSIEGSIEYFDYNNRNSITNSECYLLDRSGTPENYTILGWESAYPSASGQLDRAVGQNSMEVTPTYDNAAAGNFRATVATGRWGRPVGIDPTTGVIK